MNCCDDINIIRDNGYNVCTNCGVMDFDNCQFVMNTFRNDTTLIVKQQYKRLIYFRQKINMICCFTLYPNNKSINSFIKIHKNKKFKNMYKLKKLMKEDGLNTYYKYIYSIYNAITGHKIINIRRDTIDNIVKQFIKIEQIFKKNISNKHMYSYDIIIYYLMMINNIKGYKKMVLPYNRKKVKIKVTELFNKCGYV